MRRKLFRFVVNVLLLGETLGASGCDDKINPAEPCALVGSPVTYTGTMNNLLTVHCVSCHASNLKTGKERSGATVGVDYDSYATAVAWGEEAREFVMGGLMPPPPSVLNANDRCAFAIWARNGFPR